MNGQKHKALYLAHSLAWVLAALAGCSADHTAASWPEIVHDVNVVVAKQSNVPDWLEVPGTVRAAETSGIASQVAGNIIDIPVREGDRVQGGQVLAVVDPAQPRAALDQATAAQNAAAKEITAAESQFALADATLKRYQQLVDKKSVSAQEYEEIKSRFAAAEARRDAARANHDQAGAAAQQARTTLSYTQIRAPFAGVITQRKIDPGTLATPGAVLFVIEDTRRFRLEATVNESDIAMVKTGASVPVSLDALPDSDLTGKVVQIVPAADPLTRTFTVKIDLPGDSRLRSGLFGRARILRGSRTAMLLPRSAIVERGQLRVVFVVEDNGLAQLRYVALGRNVDTAVEVLSGIQDGDKYVSDPGVRDLGGKQVGTKP